jgi:hypothetical protein
MKIELSTTPSNALPGIYGPTKVQKQLRNNSIPWAFDEVVDGLLKQE